MWFFKKKSAPYNLSTQLFKETYPIQYVLYDGVRVSDQKEFSIFEIKADQSPFQQSLAQNAVKIWRTFRHPAIPLFVESYEYDGATYIVTNKLVPFDDRKLSDSELAWASYIMADFVNFLSEDAKAVHGNIQDSALYMTYGHELKISGLHWMTVNGSGPITDYYNEWANLCQLANPKPPIDSPTYSIDVRFIGSYLKRWESRLPRTITKFSTRWIPTFKNPPSPQAFLSMEYWKTDNFIVTLISLRDLPLKDQQDRDNFFKSLVDILEIFSVETQEYTILPILLQSLSFAQTSAVLEAISAIGQNIKPESFGAKIAPALLPLFECKDRNVRVHLLSHIGSLIDHFSEKIVNEKIFPNVVQGFNDTAVALKASTIVSMVSLAPHLSSNNVKTMLRELERLQNDPDSSIRCNAVICIAKIAEFISSEFRTGTLISCFTKAAKDSFAQTRKAAVSAFKSCSEFFNDQIVAINIMPVISPLCVDQNFEVKCLALKQMKEYVEALGKNFIFEDEKEEKEEKKPQTVNSPPKKAVAASVNSARREASIDADDDDWGTPIEVKKKEPIRSQTSSSSLQRNQNAKVVCGSNKVSVDDDDDDWGDAISIGVKNNARTQKVANKPPSQVTRQRVAPSGEPSKKIVVEEDTDGWGDLDDDDFADAISVSLDSRNKQKKLPERAQAQKSDAQQNADDDDWGKPTVVPVKHASNVRSGPIKQVRNSSSQNSNPSSTIRPADKKHSQAMRGKKIIIQKVDQGWDDDIDWDES